MSPLDRAIVLFAFAMTILVIARIFFPPEDTSTDDWP